MDFSKIVKSRPFKHWFEYGRDFPTYAELFKNFQSMPHSSKNILAGVADGDIL